MCSGSLSPSVCLPVCQWNVCSCFWLIFMMQGYAVWLPGHVQVFSRPLKWCSAAAQCECPLDPCPSGLTKGHALPHQITPVEATLPATLSKHCWEKCLGLWANHTTLHFCLCNLQEQKNISEANTVFFFLQPFYGLMAVVKWFISNFMLWVLSNSFW